MTTFDKREEAFEKKFAHDEELMFKATARRNRMLGMWAAEKLGFSGDKATDYAKDVATIGVYVYDPDTSTVKRREVTVGGIRENRIIVLDGVAPGDRLASAGVSFLTDGQKVKLLDEGG